MTNDVTRILQEMNSGESLSAEHLLPLVYDELRRLAGKRMSQEGVDHTLQPTALVHEAYMRLVRDADSKWENRGHFYAAAAEAMRRILIEAARRKASLKRGGSYQRVEFDEGIAAGKSQSPESLLALDAALEKLAIEDADSYKLVMLRYFGGLTVEESAAALGVSPRTAKRNWAFARAWLQEEIGNFEL